MSVKIVGKVELEDTVETKCYCVECLKNEVVEDKKYCEDCEKKIQIEKNREWAAIAPPKKRFG